MWSYQCLCQPGYLLTNYSTANQWPTCVLNCSAAGTSVAGESSCLCNTGFIGTYCETQLGYVTLSNGTTVLVTGAPTSSGISTVMAAVYAGVSVVAAAVVAGVVWAGIHFGIFSQAGVWLKTRLPLYKPVTVPTSSGSTKPRKRTITDDDL